MKQSRLFMLATAAIVAGSSLISCEKAPDLAGSWTCAPRHLSNTNGTFTASSIDVLNFSNGTEGNKSGTVVISSMISAQQTFIGTANLTEPYQETVAATASISGNWAFREDDDDDVDIILDFGTLKVYVDPAGVAFSQNLITGREQPQLDSLAASAVSRWQQSLIVALKPYYSEYIHLDDVEVKNNMLHTENNDADLTFTREAIR